MENFILFSKMHIFHFYSHNFFFWSTFTSIYMFMKIYTHMCLHTLNPWTSKLSVLYIEHYVSFQVYQISVTLVCPFVYLQVVDWVWWRGGSGLWRSGTWMVLSTVKRNVQPILWPLWIFCNVCLHYFVFSICFI